MPLGGRVWLVDPANPRETSAYALHSVCLPGKTLFLGCSKIHTHFPRFNSLGKSLLRVSLQKFFILLSDSVFGGLVCGLNNKSSRILEKSELFGGTRGVGLMRRHKKHNVNPVKKQLISL